MNCCYITYDGCECQEDACVVRNGEGFCKRHARAIETGIDPVYEEQENN